MNLEIRRAHSKVVGKTVLMITIWLGSTTRKIAASLTGEIVKEATTLATTDIIVRTTAESLIAA